VKENTRLGIPVLFHDECLHGHVAPGATSYPQAIALSSTWDPALVQSVFTATAAEVRARGVHHCLAPVLVVKPFPGGDSKSASDTVPNTTAAVMLRRRVPMKNVMSGKHDDCVVVIASTHSDIKLDKLTTYVFAADELRASK
jgi:hypothetical protein